MFDTQKVLIKEKKNKKNIILMFHMTIKNMRESKI